MKNRLIRLLKPFIILYYYNSYLKLRRNIKNVLKKDLNVICIFPSYNIGGAEKVHIQILKALTDYNVATLIVHKSKNNILKNDFKSFSNYFIDFKAIGNYNFFKRKLTNIISDNINSKQTKCTIFGCNAEMFYCIIDKIKNDKIKKVDLLHAFSPYSKGIELRSISSVDKLDNRIVINKRTLDDYKTQYKKYGVAEEEVKKINIIYNSISYNCINIIKDFEVSPLKCLWVGRNSNEKRPHLYLKIAERINKENLPFTFSVVGNFKMHEKALSSSKINFYGEIKEEKELDNIYSQHHLLLNTSYFEGFPLSIAEGMCKGLINISVNTGGISEHIIYGETGYLIDNYKEEEEIVFYFLKILKNIYKNKKELKIISEKANMYAIENFSFKNFKEKYIYNLINE